MLVDAALGAGVADLRACAARLAALETFSREPGYAQAVQTFKRVANILRKQGKAEPLPPAWDAALLREEPEKALADTLEDLLPRLDALWAAEIMRLHWRPSMKCARQWSPFLPG